MGTVQWGLQSAEYCSCSSRTNHQVHTRMLCLALSLLLLSQGFSRPQDTFRGVSEDRSFDLGSGSGPDCNSIFRRSLPECQHQAAPYGLPGQIWGELTVEVSSPVLFITNPKDRKEKRREKNRERQGDLVV